MVFSNNRICKRELVQWCDPFVVGEPMPTKSRENLNFVVANGKPLACPPQHGVSTACIRVRVFVVNARFLFQIYDTFRTAVLQDYVGGVSFSYINGFVYWKY